MPGAGVSGDDVERRVGQRRDRVEAEIAPQLEPDIVADLGIDLGLEAAGDEGLGEGLHARGLLARWLAEPEAVAVDVLDDARRDDLGRGIDGAADGAFRPDAPPLPSVGIDALQLQIGVLPFEAVKIPPGNAVLRGDHGGIGAEQRRDGIRRLPGLVRFQRDDDVVLRPELGGIGGRLHARDLLAALDEEL